MMSAPSMVLAVHDPRLGRVQRQPDLGHPATDLGQQVLRMLTRLDVHHDVIDVPGELDPRLLSRHPRIEGVVQEQVGRQLVQVGAGLAVQSPPP